MGRQRAELPPKKKEKIPSSPLKNRAKNLATAKASSALMAPCGRGLPHCIDCVMCMLCLLCLLCFKCLRYIKCIKCLYYCVSFWH